VDLQGKLGFFHITSTIFCSIHSKFFINKGLFGDGGFFEELGPAPVMLLL
jgi:hypothetical protein